MIRDHFEISDVQMKRMRKSTMACDDECNNTVFALLST